MEAKVKIGSRWAAGHVLRRDSETGIYEEVNPPIDGQFDRMLQDALIGSGPKALVRKVSVLPVPGFVGEMFDHVQQSVRRANDLFSWKTQTTVRVRKNRIRGRYQ